MLGRRRLLPSPGMTWGISEFLGSAAHGERLGQPVLMLMEGHK